MTLYLMRHKPQKSQRAHLFQVNGNALCKSWALAKELTKVNPTPESRAPNCGLCYYRLRKLKTNGGEINVDSGAPEVGDDGAADPGESETRS